MDSYSVEPIAVDIGLGFYLECSHVEALNIIDSRISILNGRADMYKKRANSIKAQIKLFLEVSYLVISNIILRVSEISKILNGTAKQ